MGGLYRRNARDAEGIGKMILSDDAIALMTGLDENNVKMTEGDPACAEDARSDGWL
jgi:hypothetical protein